MYQTKKAPATGKIIGTPDPDRMARILAEIWGREHGVVAEVVTNVL